MAAVRHAIRAVVLSQAAPLGLSVREFWFLVGIAETPGCSQAELAARLRVDEPTISRGIRSLAVRGWVRAERGASDRRRVRVDLTPSGRALARRLVPVARDVRAAVEAPLAPEEREATRAALAKIIGHLQDLARTPPRPAARRRTSARFIVVHDPAAPGKPATRTVAPR